MLSAMIPFQFSEEFHEVITVDRLLEKHIVIYFPVLRDSGNKCCTLNVSLRLCKHYVLVLRSIILSSISLSGEHTLIQIVNCSIFFKDLFEVKLCFFDPCVNIALKLLRHNLLQSDCLSLDVISLVKLP